MKTEQLITFTKVIPDFPNYRISKEGDVWSAYKYKTNTPIDTWRQVQPVVDKGTGYPLVTLCHEGVRKNKHIHRLLAVLFIPNPENKPHVNHIDANKENFVLSNLEWATSKENSMHAAMLGLYPPQASSRSVLQICKHSLDVLNSFKSIHEAGRSTGVQWQNIWKVCDGRRHTAGGFKWAYQ